jgi:ABC-type multidrug transport system permease subunit
MWRRILAIFVARNREFYRDRAGLGWNIFMPMLMVLSFAFIFSEDPPAPFKVGVLTADGTLPTPPTGLLTLEHIQFIPVTDLEAAIAKVDRHQLDLLLDPAPEPDVYWVNRESPQGYLAERLLLTAAGGGATGEGTTAPPRRHERSGNPLRYADWVLPGILAMNILFSSLWGVGWVIVRYRKNGVLRRLKATPLSPFEFLAAQILSRLVVVMGASLIVYGGAALVIDFPMRGSHVALALIYLAGAICLISLGLIVSARLRTEELADGILNLISLPLLLLSGVWFSMEGTSAAAQLFSQLSPLTHVVDGARAIMIDGAQTADVLPQVLWLTALALVFLAIAARLFRWE